MVVFSLLTALAAPPSSSLTGEDGTLDWTVSPTEAGITVDGKSPKWTVHHEARADFTPVRTERLDIEGNKVVIEYNASGAVLTVNNETTRFSQANLWDGDTLDVRLGHLVSTGKPVQKFKALDSGSGKVYGFDSQDLGEEQCGAAACRHVLVQLTGIYRWVGPSFHYWYAADGELVRFEGPAGNFAKKGN
ncbi:MAG: hypothetical protein EP330_08050 [Deltaproteobacteria bacterium]|nr:MAG: hypothetical protein EP330_08050 [Deltaproteobacteria bacterium]